MGLRSLEVGGIFPPAVGVREGVSFVADSSGIILSLNYQNPTSKEIECWQSGEMAEFTFCVRQNILFFLARVPGQEWVDAPFDPGRYSNPLSEVLGSQGYGVLVIMTDSPGGVIKLLRLIGLGNSFSIHLKKTIDEIMRLPHDPQDYLNRLIAVYQRHSSRELAGLGAHKYKLR